MRTAILRLGTIAFLPLAIGGCPAGDVAGDAIGTVTSGTSAAAGVVPDQLIINVTPGADAGALNQVVEAAGGTLLDRLDAISAVLIEVDPSQRDAAEETLTESPLVEGTADNHQYDVDPGDLSSAGSTGWHLAAVDAAGAWDITTGSSNVLVAVLDTGVDASHPFLAGKLVSGANVSDGVSGWSDTVGHGTAVASIVVGAAAAVGATTIGIAPGVRVLPIRVTDSKNTATSWSLAAGIALAADQGACVINISMAPDGIDSDEFLLRQSEAARLRGSLVVMAMGNSGQRTSDSATDAVVFVGAVDQQLARASFSTYGPALTLVAPGVDILGAQLGGGPASFDGTSLAAPIVSGIAALAASANPSLQPSTLRAILESTTADLGAAGWDESYGAGLVNAADAVNLARATSEVIDTAAPTIIFQAPADAATVSGLIDVTLSVTDAADLADVTLLIDDRPLASDSVSPYAFVLNVDAFTPRKHVLTVRATDVFGNAASETITLEFVTSADTRPPTFSIAAPAAGATLSGSVTLRVDAADDRRLERCVFVVGGQTIATVTLDGAQAPAVYVWDVAASSVSVGDATLTVKVYDAAGNIASESVRVRVSR